MVRKKTTPRKTASKKKLDNKLSNEIFGLISLFITILGLAQLGFIGNLIIQIVQFFFGELYFAILVLQAVISIWYIFTGHGPVFRNRITISILLLIPILSLLAHAWGYIDIAYDENATIIGATFDSAVANFTSQEGNNNLGGGLFGALLYTITFFTVSQLGTYILIGFALITVLCFLLGITWQDVIEGIQMIWAKMIQIISNLSSQIAMGFSDLKAERQEKRESSNSGESKTAEKTKRRSRRKKQTDEGSLIEVDQLDVEEKDLEIIGPNRIKPNRTQEELAVETHDVKDNKSSNDQPQAVPLFDEALGASQQPTPVNYEKTEKDMVNEEEDDTSDIDNIRMEAEEDNPDYELPDINLLSEMAQTDQSGERDIILENARKLEETFKSFNVDATVRKANLGPAVTKYEVQPAVGVKVSKIVNLADDIALALAAKDIRIEAPIPGKSFIGIEVPNQQVSLVSFRDSFENQPDTDKLLEVPLGRDISGNIRSANLTAMPHLLVAGSTGSGKSVAINGIIVSILMKAKPNEVKMMMIDPKKVELNVYNGIPHLLTPVVTNPRKAAAALQKVVQEMEKRYELFAATGHRNITGYNEHITEYNLEHGKNDPKLPFIVVVVDELADLMMVASKEVEAAITRLAQMARAAGIHMILATQRPSVDVITGIIKANVPSRIAFAVSSGIDSRTIIDQNGAEKLLGRGDMLFMPMGEGKPIRIQGAYITDDDVEKVVDFVKNQQEANYVEAMMPSDKPDLSKGEELDGIYDEAIDFVKKRETVSISMLQRKFRIGYNRAARIIDDMEQRGVVSEADGSKPRTVNIYEEDVEEPDMQ